jgi:hypothetical protein
VPDTGGTRWFDTMMIPKGAAQVDNAASWMDFVYDPVTSARITFRSEQDEARVRGDVTDGKFEINHVKPGQYAVSIRSTDDAEADVRVPRKYRSATRSGLTIEVQDGENEFDFELTSE